MEYPRLEETNSIPAIGAMEYVMRFEIAADLGLDILHYGKVDEIYSIEHSELRSQMFECANSPTNEDNFSPTFYIPGLKSK